MNDLIGANAVPNRNRHTLMMMTKVDWNKDGEAFGSNTVELDWNDRKSPVISRLSAKLLRNNTCSIKYSLVGPFLVHPTY